MNKLKNIIKNNRIFFGNILKPLQKPCVIILMILMFSVLLCSCSDVDSNSGTVVDNRPSGYGNTSANLCNAWGQIAQDENYVYYYSENDNEKPVLNKSSFDFRETIMINNISGSMLNILNNCIYYINDEDKSAIYKIDTDGKNNQKISDIESILILMTIDDKLYFVHGDEGPDGIYVMDTDGNNLKQLTDLCAINMYVCDDVIYFIEYQTNNEQCSIYKMNIDGTEQTLVLSSDDEIDNLLIYNDYIYYTIPDYTIFKINVNGGEPGIVVEGGENLWGTINICNNTIYYCTSQFTSRGIHALNLDTKEDKILTEKFANNIYVINNQIYFWESENDNINYYRMKFDGSNLMKLW